MSKIQKLKALKNQIINKLVTAKSLEKTKNEEMLKGGFFKQFFKYVFLKPFRLKKIDSSEARFLLDDKCENAPKIVILGLFFGFNIIGAIVSLFTLSIIPILISLLVYLGITTVFILFINILWISENNETKRKFNIKNLEKIKQNLTENHHDYQIKKLLEGNLDKKNLTNIIKELAVLVGENDVLDCFGKVRKDNNYERVFNDISEPYVLIKMIDQFILNEKEREKEKERGKSPNEKEIIEFNNKVLNSIINSSNEESKIKREIENMKDVIYFSENSKEDVRSL